MKVWVCARAQIYTRVLCLKPNKVYLCLFRRVVNLVLQTCSQSTDEASSDSILRGIDGFMERVDRNRCGRGWEGGGGARESSSRGWVWGGGAGKRGGGGGRGTRSRETATQRVRQTWSSLHFLVSAASPFHLSTSSNTHWPLLKSANCVSRASCRSFPFPVFKVVFQISAIYIQQHVYMYACYAEIWRYGHAEIWR
jgi:hypothetical protein